MKRYTKLISLLMVFLLLLSMIAACKKESDDPIKAASKAYNALKTIEEKLFHVVEVEHPTAKKVSGIASKNLDLLSVINNNGKNAEADFSAELDKLFVKNTDYISKLNGKPISLKGKLLSDGTTSNLDLNASFSGIDFSAGVSCDDNAVMLDCPALFNKPFYFKNSVTSEIVSEAVANLSGETTYGTYLVALQSTAEWSGTYLVDEKIKYILGLFKSSIPTDGISAEEVVVPELKGDYITDELKAECITLKLDSKSLDKLFVNVNNTVLTDLIVKELIISFADVLVECGYIEAEEGYGERVYEDVCEKFGEFVKNFDEVNGGFAVTVKRYFIDGFDVKFEIIVEENGENSLSMSYWNAYNDTARQYGAKFNIKGEELLNISGGANETDADLGIKIATYKDGVSFTPNGEAFFDKNENVALELDASNKSDKLNISGSFKDEDEKVNITFNASDDDSGCVVNAKAIKDGKENAVLSLNVKPSDGIFKLNSVLTLKNEGKDHKISANADITETDGDGEYTAKVDFDVTSGGLINVSGKLSFSMDSNSDATLKVPTEAGSFVVNGKHDVIYIPMNFTSAFKAWVANKGEAKPDDESVAQDAELSCENSVLLDLQSAY